MSGSTSALFDSDFGRGASRALNIHTFVKFDAFLMNLSPNLMNLSPNSPKFDFDVLNIIKSLKPKDNLQINFLTSGNFKKKLSKANKLNSFACIILAENEWKEKQLIWKDLIYDSQEMFYFEKIEEFLNHKLNKK